MKWNKVGNYNRHFQTSRKGTARAHAYYFVTQHGTGDNTYAVGYYGFNRQIVMKSAGTFETAELARAYCEKVDNEAVIITAVI